MGPMCCKKVYYSHLLFPPKTIDEKGGGDNQIRTFQFCLYVTIRKYSGVFFQSKLL